MNTSLGYAKKTLTDTSVLLSGGGDKPLSDFIGSISWDSTNKKIKYTPVGASSATDLVTFGSNAFNSTDISAYYPCLNRSGKWNFSGNGTYQYCYIAEINTDASYINYPITFEIAGRGNIVSRITIQFKNQQAVDPECAVFATDNATCYYLYKAAANTWRLYSSSPSDSTWGWWYVYRVIGGIANRVTMQMTGLTSLPEGYITPTYTGRVNYASSSGEATNIAGGAQGSIPYQSAEGTTSFLAGGTNGYVLAYNTTSKAPYWKADSNTQYYLTLNGTVNGTASTTNLGTIYAPTSAGTGFLKGTAGANGAITWSWDNSTYNNYSLSAATDSALGGVKIGTTLTSTTGYTKVHIKDNFIYYKDTNTWQAANTSQVGYVPATIANALLYTNSSGATAWGSPTLLSVALNGNTDTTSGSEESSLAYKDILSFFFGSCIYGFIDKDGINIYHDSYHSNDLTIGSSTASSGGTVAVPYITVDQYGHVTGGGTHDHTISVSGYLSTGGGTMTGAITVPCDTQAIKIEERTGSGIKYDQLGNEALMISARDYADASILFYAGMGNNNTKSLNNTTGQWSTTGIGAMGTPSMQMKYSSVLINTPVQTGALSGDYASALYVTGDTYLGGGVKSAMSIWSGTTSDTDERQVGVKSSAGTLYMYSQGSSTGVRGLFVGAHGNSSGKGIIGIDTNNNATFYGNVSGSATSAGSASTAGSAGSATYSTYLSSNTGGIAANTTSSLTYYNTSTTTTLNTTNGVANPTTADSGTWYHHITMVRGDSHGYFFDLAFSLADANNPKIYFRNRASSNYSAWTEIITSANISEYVSEPSNLSATILSSANSLGTKSNARIMILATSSTSGTVGLDGRVYICNAFYVNKTGVYFTSDEKLKENITKYVLKQNVLDLENPIKEFTWKDSDGRTIGFIAQEVEKWCPEAVGENEEGYKTVNYNAALSGLCSALYDEIKNLKKEIEELKNKK